MLLGEAPLGALPLAGEDDAPLFGGTAPIVISATGTLFIPMGHDLWDEVKDIDVDVDIPDIQITVEPSLGIDA